MKMGLSAFLKTCIMGSSFNLKTHPPIERNTDGSLIRMSLQQWWAAKRIIRERCCNLQDENDCLLLDDGEEANCPQLHSRSVCCTSFRYILLKEKEAMTLEEDLFGSASVRRCVLCGKPYIAHGNRAKYCDECKVVARKKQQADYAKRKRSNSRKIEL